MLCLEERRITMISEEEMIECHGKHVRIEFTDGDIWENRYCNSFLNQEEDDEENMLLFDNIAVNQSEIKSIKILD